MLPMVLVVVNEAVCERRCNSDSWPHAHQDAQLQKWSDCLQIQHQWSVSWGTLSNSKVSDFEMSLQLEKKLNARKPF